MTFTNLLRYISLKHLILKKSQTLMAATGICLGVAAMLSIDIVNQSVLSSFEDSINSITGRAALQITGAESGFPEQLADRIQQVQGVEYALPVIETNASISGGKERAVMILAVDSLQDHKIRSYRITDESADIPDPLMFLAKRDSILLTREMANREGIKIDQEIQVQTVQGIKKFVVRGLLDPDGPAKAAGGDIAIMDVYAAQLVFGKEGRIDRIDVSFLPGQDLDTMKQRIESALPEGYYVDTPAGRARQIELLTLRYRKSMSLIGSLTMFVGMYLIYNAISISVVQRKKEIGIMRALGATRAQVAGLFLGETFIISVLASIVGVGLGLVFARLSVGAVAQAVSTIYANASGTQIVFSWKVALSDMTIGICASLFAACFPARSSARIAPVSAIRTLPYSPEGFLLGRKIKIWSAALVCAGIITLLIYKAAGASSAIRNSGTTFASMIFLLLGISLATPLFLKWFMYFYHRFLAAHLGSEGRLAGLNLQKNLSRNAVAVAAIFFSIALSVNSSTMLSSAQKGFLDYMDSVERSDILVTSGHPMASAGGQNSPMPGSMAREIESVPGVKTADPFRKLYLNYSGRRILLEMVDFDRWMQYNTCTVVDGKWDDLRNMSRQDNVLINENIAARYRLKAGDTIDLPTPNGPVHFHITAVIVSYASDSGVIVMDTYTYQRYWKDTLADMFSVRVKPGQSITTVQAAIMERFGHERKLFVMDSQAFKEELKKLLDQAFVMNNAVNIITLVIAGFGIIVTLLASVLERTREIGILRSIGMKRSQVAGVVILESMLVGIVGGIAGAATGLAIGWLSVEGFFRLDLGASMEYSVHYGSILIALVLAAGLSAIAGLYPAHRAAKTNIVEALSYE